MLIKNLYSHYLIELESKMLLFNGLYFRGDWNQKFKKMEEKLPFENYKEKQDVKYMKSDGLFKFAEISSQNLIAVELPYKVIELFSF